MKEEIKNVLLSLGADACGIADNARFGQAPKEFAPSDIFPKCQSVIVFGVAIPKSLFSVSPRIIYSHFNSMSTEIVDKIAFDAAKIIENQYAHCTAVPIPCDGPYDYWDEKTLTGKGTISMKHAAVFAGLGTLGKNSLLISPKFGNRLTVGAILTDLVIEPDEMLPEICVESCTKCIDSCPVHAIENKHVNQTLCRPNTYGKTARGFDTVECNNCRRVCPFSKL